MGISAHVFKSLFHVTNVIKNETYPEKTKFKFISLINKLRSSVQVKKKNGGGHK